MNRILAGGIAAIALAFGAAHAQTADKNAAPETGNRPMQTGVSESNGNKPAVVQRAEDSRVGQATKRTARKAKNATKRAGHRAADATRNTGEAIGRHVPGNDGTATTTTR